MRTPHRRTAKLVRWCSVGAALIAATVLTPAAAGATPTDGWPFGGLDTATWTTSTQIRATGWAADVDAPEAALEVHLYVDGVPAASIVAAGDRPDVAAAYPAVGAPHGFDHTLTVSRGAHEVCAYGINVGGGSNGFLGCRYVGASPLGAVDTWTRRPGGLQVTGWTLDPETSASTGIHVYVDNDFAGAFPAADDRPDVGAIVGRGSAHGFSVPITVPEGTHQVCVYGIDADGDPNSRLRCFDVTISGDPFGSLDVLEPAEGGLHLAGWIIDPDTAGPSRLDVYVDGAFTSLPANGARPDVGAAYPGYGDNHGFDGMVPVPDGATSVCLYIVDVAAPGRSLGGCV